MKIASKTKPRLVVWVSEEELAAAKTMARKDGLRTPHAWLAALMRRALAKKP